MKLMRKYYDKKVNQLKHAKLISELERDYNLIAYIKDPNQTLDMTDMVSEVRNIWDDICRLHITAENKGIAR